MPIVQKSPFTIQVIKVVQSIPAGKVATYKQVAELAGNPGASRGVSWILHSCSTVYKMPWHRVINSKGGISFEKDTHNFRAQKRFLQQEGVVVSDIGEIDLKQFQWKKKINSSRTGRKRKSMTRPALFSK